MTTDDERSSVERREVDASFDAGKPVPTLTVSMFRVDGAWVIRHTHPDDTLTAGCPACVERVRVDQRVALIDAAPLRRCTWTCSYSTPGDPSRRLTFTRDVRVPAGWTGWDVDDEYADLTGEGFVMALPSDVAITDTGYALETMDVVDVRIGAVVATSDPESAEMPTLFEVA